MKLLDVQDIGPAFQGAADYLKSHWAASVEELSMNDAWGRVLAADVRSSEAIPNFTRSTVDGYAVRAGDVGGANEAIPSFLSLAGEVAMGDGSQAHLSPGTCIYVPTGGMIPAGADAMVMVEYTEKIMDQIAIYKAVAVGDGILHAGSDVEAGETLLTKGRRLKPYDISTLASIGQTTVPVYKKPRLWVFSSGDEIVPSECSPAIGQVRDSNAAGVQALAERQGWECVGKGHLPDDPDAYLDRLAEACAEADLVVVSGGSSKGARDYTASSFEALGEPGLMTHGIAMKPGKPTILAGARDSLLVGLPGHPVSALLVWERLLESLDQGLYGISPPAYEPMLLAENLAGSPGQLRMIPAQLITDEGREMVRPIAGRSGQVSLLSRADALIVLDKTAEGAAKGDVVKIRRI